MIELIDPSRELEIIHPSGAKFRARQWTVAMQDDVDKRCLAIGQDGKVSYDTALERELRIDLSIIGWAGIVISGEDAPCTSENKKRLPVGVVLWLQREIEERAGLRITQEEKKS